MPGTIMGLEDPEAGPEELGFHELLSEVARKRISDELKTNRIATELLFVVSEEKLPAARKKGMPTPFGLLTELVDSQKGSLDDRLLDFKLDLIDFIERKIGVERGRPEKNREKQLEYEQAMEKLFQAIGSMEPQGEYRMLTERLRDAEPETYEPNRLALMKNRKQELETEHGMGKRK